MKKFLTMTFVITLLSSTSVLGATSICVNKLNNCKIIRLVSCNKLNYNNNCFGPKLPVISDNVNDVITDDLETPIIEEIVETPVKDEVVTTPVSPSTDGTEENIEENITDSILAIEKEVVELVNKERAKYGLSPLEIDTEVSKIARLKSQDMANLNYFSHTSPTYGSPFDMLKKFNISYKSAGENIAMGQKTAEAVVNAWMNSEGHRANILNSSYTHIGVGYVLSGNTPYWTQMFISK